MEAIGQRTILKKERKREMGLFDDHKAPFREQRLDQLIDNFQQIPKQLDEILKKSQDIHAQIIDLGACLVSLSEILVHIRKLLDNLIRTQIECTNALLNKEKEMK